MLAVRELQRRARLQRPPLAVRQGDEAALRDSDGVAARRKLADLEPTGLVRHGGAPARQLRGGHHDARPLHRLAIVGRRHMAGDAARRSRRVFLRRRVARGLLLSAASLRGECHRRAEADEEERSKETPVHIVLY